MLSIDGTPLPASKRPLAHAVDRREVLEDLFIVARGDTRTTTRVAIAPFFGADGEFVGASVSLEPV